MVNCTLVQHAPSLNSIMLRLFGHSRLQCIYSRLMFEAWRNKTGQLDWFPVNERVKFHIYGCGNNQKVFSNMKETFVVFHFVSILPTYMHIHNWNYKQRGSFSLTISFAITAVISNKHHTIDIQINVLYSFCYWSKLMS